MISTSPLLTIFGGGALEKKVGPPAPTRAIALIDGKLAIFTVNR